MKGAAALLKIVHELGSAGIIGALVTHVVLLARMPADPTARLETCRTMGMVAQWVVVPSLGACLVSGLFAMAIQPRFHDAGWAWIKALTGVGMLEGTFGSVVGPARDAAAAAARIAAGEGDPTELDALLRHERNGLLAILFLSTLNVVLGVWRPRLRRQTAQKRSPERE